LLDLLWPAACLGCGRSGNWWCPACQAALMVSWHWRQLRLPLDSGLIAVSYCANYRQPLVNKLLKQTKYGRLTIPGRVLAINFANFIQQTLINQAWFKTSWLTAVPLSRQRHHWRGFNQAELLSRALAKASGRPLLNHWQRWNRPQQARLARTERLANLNEAFHWSTPLFGENFIIVDDVATTGTTLIQAARCLRQAGAGKIWGLVLAH